VAGVAQMLMLDVEKRLGGIGKLRLVFSMKAASPF
jgi:hypothetical protein